jgi:tRNA wybutosine-synthesizing protein 3
MDRFSKQKKHALNKLNISIRMNDADAGIIPLLEAINALEDYYTTSSCAGRIQLFHDLGSKADNHSIACWHRRVKPSETLDAFRTAEGTVYFKCEPPIIHVAARDIEAARKLLVAARECGFKHSGIQSIKPGRIIVELASTETLDAPLSEGNRKMAADAYLKYLTALANRKHSKSHRKLRKLEKTVKTLC